MQKIRVSGLLLATAAIIPAVGCQVPASSSSSSSSSSPATAPLTVIGNGPRVAPGGAVGVVPHRPPLEGHRAPLEGHRAPLGQAGGAVPDGATVFDDEVPGVANLNPALLAALRQAATAAVDYRVEIVVDSGWRSPEYQQRLLEAAISKYGSEKEAARWVATPETSAHVSGDAVDVGSSTATEWLSAHGAQYGLCQIYDNEPWHYELRPEAADSGCPARYADAAHDPRMQH